MPGNAQLEQTDRLELPDVVVVENASHKLILN